MIGSHSYQHLIRETNEDMTSSYSDPQHTQDRRPEQLPYTKDGGTSSTMTPEQKNHTLESNDSTSTNSTEKVSHQITNPQSSSTQTKNLPYQDPNRQNHAKMIYQHSPAHLSLTRISASLPHHQTKTPPPNPNIDDLHHQTNIALASLLFSRNNNHPQQIW